MHSTVIDQNDLVKLYSYQSLISSLDNQMAVGEISEIISQGNYFQNSPKFQTNENVFQRSGPHWLKYRMSFIFSCFMYLGREVKISNTMAWSFMTNLSTAENRDKLWHHHHHKPESNMLSGIYYLHIPDDVNDRDYCGTEIAPNGPEKDGKFFVKPADFSWIIYPSSLWHRPGIAQSDKYRYVLAADLEYV
jgi:hypothetical protein